MTTIEDKPIIYPSLPSETPIITYQLLEKEKKLNGMKYKKTNEH